MASRRAGGGFAFALLAIVLVATALGVGMLPRPFVDGSQPTATPHAAGTPAETDASARITISNDNGTVLSVVNATLAVTSEERYTGLSDTPSLANGSGMLFVYDDESNHAFVMRRMDFPLDIVFIGTDGTINVIHPAPVPPEGTQEGDLKRYTGDGKWVLEVPRGWMAAQGISAGDHVEVEYLATETNITTEANV